MFDPTAKVTFTNKSGGYIGVSVPKSVGTIGGGITESDGWFEIKPDCSDTWDRVVNNYEVKIGDGKESRVHNISFKDGDNVIILSMYNIKYK